MDGKGKNNWGKVLRQKYNSVQINKLESEDWRNYSFDIYLYMDSSICQNFFRLQPASNFFSSRTVQTVSTISQHFLDREIQYFKFINTENMSSRFLHIQCGGKILLYVTELLSIHVHKMKRLAGDEVFRHSLSVSRVLFREIFRIFL